MCANEVQDAGRMSPLAAAIKQAGESFDRSTNPIRGKDSMQKLGCHL